MRYVSNDWPREAKRRQYEENRNELKPVDLPQAHVWKYTKLLLKETSWLSPF